MDGARVVRHMLQRGVPSLPPQKSLLLEKVFGEKLAVKVWWMCGDAVPEEEEMRAPFALLLILYSFQDARACET